jgi:hypothetical protein
MATLPLAGIRVLEVSLPSSLLPLFPAPELKNFLVAGDFLASRLSSGTLCWQYVASKLFRRRTELTFYSVVSGSR